MTPADRNAEGFVSVAVLGEPRLVLRLEAPVVVSGLFGRSKEADAIGVTVDDEAGFLAALGKRPTRP